MEYKFTKELKHSWLTALKSGKYIQGTGRLRRNYQNKVEHCCLGVLCELLPDVKISKKGLYLEKHLTTSYDLLGKLIGTKNIVQNLAEVNDTKFDPDKPDYSNVIPLIEALPTID